MKKVTTSIRVIIPEATRNYIKNPAIRQDTTGWNASGSAVSRATDEARFGFSSLKVITNGVANIEGVYYRVNTLSAYDSACTVSAYVRGEGEVRIRLISSGGKQWASKTVDLTSERWTRIEITGRCQSTNDVRLYVETYGDAPQAVTFYVDGAQMELHPFSTTYCDGEQDGCFWTALFDGSESLRPASTRRGGRWVALSGPLRDYDDDIYMTFVTGGGMASLDVNIQPYATRPGGYFDNTKINSRVLQLTFHVKDSSGQSAAVQRLHHLKQELVDIFKPDRTYGDEPFLLEYSVADNPPLYINVHYDGGLEGSGDIRNKWTNGFVLRFIAPDPFWYEDSQELTELDFSDTEGDNTVGIARKSGVDGAWDFVPIVADIKRIVEGPDGRLYFASDTVIYTYDGTTVTTIGLPNGGLGKTGFYDFSVALDGTIWAIVTPFGATGIFYYSGGAWTGVAGSSFSQVYGIAVDIKGDVYVSGTVPGNNWVFQRYDGVSWHFPAAGSGATFTVVGGSGRKIVLSPDRRYIYVVGNFTLVYSSGNTSGGVLKYSIEEDDFLDEVSDAAGVDAGGKGQQLLHVTSDNRLYMDGSSGTALLYFNGSAWSLTNYPDGFTYATGILNSQIIGYKDAVLMGGSVDGSTDINNLLMFKSGVYYEMDFRINPVLTDIFGLLKRSNGDLYVGARTGNYAGYTTVENIGSTFVLPKIYLKGYGILNNIENGTSDVRLFFDMLLQSSEEVIVDFGRGTIEGLQGSNRLNTLSSGSELSQFSLLPKDNVINMFLRNDVDAEARIAYVPRHWSVDAVARKEAI